MKNVFKFRGRSIDGKSVVGILHCDRHGVKIFDGTTYTKVKPLSVRPIKPADKVNANAS